VTPDERWLAAVWLFVRGQLPVAPARVAEIGCGPLGGVVPMLRADGYEAVGIDPEAPQGPGYHRVEFERYEMPQPADVIVACTSLPTAKPRRPGTTGLIHLFEPHPIRSCRILSTASQAALGSGRSPATPMIAYGVRVLRRATRPPAQHRARWPAASVITRERERRRPSQLHSPDTASCWNRETIPGLVMGDIFCQSRTPTAALYGPILLPWRCHPTRRPDRRLRRSGL
jgi:hypothetical protein